MSNIVTRLFKPQDGRRAEVITRVRQSTARLEKASNRLSDTIEELLNQNDKLTRRQLNHAIIRKD